MVISAAGSRFFKESGPPVAPKFVCYAPQCTNKLIQW
ncbi:hypothetical protein SLEP1_g50275 [Rubroshorea leprosula]|uniref:Uncharacterized protein n=1 Tax=Rubroshorea leprosula TaxID=152421 RepID=A0AAV5LZG0_9ROSI|nr:hypothetical protein SLEP1_g50275 [Rubroshorea leprosula]